MLVCVVELWSFILCNGVSVQLCVNLYVLFMCMRWCVSSFLCLLVECSCIWTECMILRLGEDMFYQHSEICTHVQTAHAPGPHSQRIVGFTVETTSFGGIDACHDFEIIALYGYRTQF